MGNYTVSVTLQGKDQLSPTLKNVNKELDNLGEGSTGAQSAFGGLKDAVMGLGAAFTVAQVAQKAVELYNLGTAANNAQNTFYQLAGGAAAAELTLTKMRAATGGVVDDMALMAGANKLFAMNLAQSGTEAAKLTELAVKLGGAMGNGAAESIDNFAMMIANRSIERLDSFGIASGKVRERVEELKASGMGMEEAFSFAVLEEGRKSLERLGAAAEGSGASLNRWTTDLTNRLQDFAQNFATSINGIVGIIEIGLGANPAQLAQKAAEELKASDLQAYFDEQGTLLAEMASNMDMQMREGFDPAQTLKELWALAAEEVASGYFDTEAEAMGNAVAVLVDDMIQRGEVSDSQRMEWETALGTMFSTKPPEEVYTAAREHTRDYWNTYAEYWQNNAQKSTQRTQEQWKELSEQAQKERVERLKEQAKEEAAAAAQVTLGYANQIIGMASMDSLSASGLDFIDPSLIDGFMSQAQIAAMMPDYMTRAASESVQEQYATAAAELEKLKELNKDGLITDEQLQSAQGMTENIKGMADEAGRAADAFDRIKLSDLFGQSDGGVRGQVGDAVIQRMKDRGASDEQIQAMQDSMNMMSGRETGASQFFENTVADAISTLPEDQAAQVADAYSSLMEQAALEGLDPESVLSLQKRFVDSIFTDNMATLITVKAGDTVSGLASQYGMSSADVMGAAGISNPRLLQPGTYGAGGGYGLDPNALMNFDPMGFMYGGTSGAMGGEPTDPTAAMQDSIDATAQLSDNTLVISDNMKAVTENTREFADRIQGLTEKASTVKLNVDVDAGAFTELLKRLGVEMKNPSVRDNGGTVRGRDARVAE